MSLKTLADRLAKKALKVFDSYRETVTYDHYTGAQTYDIATDTMTRTKVTTLIRAVLLKYDEKEGEANFSATAAYTGANLQNAKTFLLFARLDATDGFDPSVGDTVTRTSGEEWRVVDAKNPPGASVFKLELTRVS